MLNFQETESEILENSSTDNSKREKEFISQRTKRTKNNCKIISKTDDLNIFTFSTLVENFTKKDLSNSDKNTLNFSEENDFSNNAIEKAFEGEKEDLELMKFEISVVDQTFTDNENANPKIKSLKKNDEKIVSISNVQDHRCGCGPTVQKPDLLNHNFQKVCISNVFVF